MGRGCWFGILVGVAWGLGVQAQQQAAVGGTPMGSVSGRVVAQDTQRAARFAVVMLQGVASASGGSDESVRRYVGGGGTTTRTDEEGNFMVDAAPGDYYVTATAPGFVPERAVLQAGLAGGASPAALLAQIPVVHVTADSVSSIVVTMERGATISGRVQWEDGSPASGLGVQATSITATNGNGGGFGGGSSGLLPGVLQGIQSAGGGGGFVLTDDRGGFRIAGLAPGEYLVRATIPPAPQSGRAGMGSRFQSAVVVYATAAFRRSDAKTISVGVGEERIDVRMVIDLRGLHTVSGTVTSSEPGKSVASGKAMLVDPNNPDVQRVSSIGADGGFVLRYVPAGSYTLEVSGSSAQNGGGGRGRESQGPVVSFQPGSQAVTVTSTDITDLAIALTPEKSSQ